MTRGLTAVALCGLIVALAVTLANAFQRRAALRAIWWQAISQTAAVAAHKVPPCIMQTIGCVKYDLTGWRRRCSHSQQQLHASNSTRVAHLHTCCELPMSAGKPASLLANPGGSNERTAAVTKLSFHPLCGDYAVSAAVMESPHL